MAEECVFVVYCRARAESNLGPSPLVKEPCESCPAKNAAPEIVVTSHALDRLGERFPGVGWVGTIKAEVRAAFAEGRNATRKPHFLVGENGLRKPSKKKTEHVWSADRTRGYVIAPEHGGWVVLTTLIGQGRGRR